MTRTSRLTSSYCLGAFLAVAVAACMEESPESTPWEEVDGSEAALHTGELSGLDLFTRETFGGNGRVCSTCHTQISGTLSPEQIQELAEEDPQNPLFHPLDSDDGAGETYERLMRDGTIRIEMPLPPNVRLKDDPGATSVIVNRGIPSVRNSPALDPVIMLDGREPDLEQQALSAVHAHAQPTREPTRAELEAIAEFERTLFTNDALRAYAQGGPPPALPQGKTKSEKRGRAFFEPDGRCGMCHSGPLLDTTSEFENLLGVGGDFRFGTVFAGFLAGIGEEQPEDAPNPIRTWEMDCPMDRPGGGFLCSNADVFGGVVEDGKITIDMPDPGVTLANGDIDFFLFFKIPSLWAVNRTAPYFHDNSAKSLEDVLIHYDKFLTAFSGTGLTAQEQKDIIAFLKLL